MNGLSELARPASPLRAGRLRTGVVYGFVVHTCGESIVDQALARNADPLEHVVAYYQRPDSFFPHYVVGWDGTIVQVCDEGVRAQHVGFSERHLFLSGSWENRLTAELVERWHAAWPAFPSPAALFPGPSPNDVYVGAEMLPVAPGGPPVAFPGARYTLAQHQAIVLLAADVARRQGFPPGWAAGPRLLCHEDLNPLTRTNAAGGWDPGALRAEPWFALRWVRELAAGRDPGPIG